MSLASRQAVMAEHHASTRRQRADRGQQRRADSFVGHQPRMTAGREIAVQIGHHPAIASVMTADTLSPPEPSALHNVTTAIAQAAHIAGRKAEAVTLIAVSKTHDADAIRPLLDEGHRVFGENRVAEAAEKWPALRAAYPGVSLHLIGQLQSNKADDAVALFDVIHSLDRLSLARALAPAMARAGRRVPCFVQVNIGEEEQKGGCAIADLPQFLEQVRALDLPVIGLMAVPPAELEPAPYFALLAKLARDNGLDQISMGMSADYETAVRIGATHVRIGSALFGGR